MGDRVKVQVKAPEAKREGSPFQTRKPYFSRTLNSPVDHGFFSRSTLGDQTVGRRTQASSLINQPPDQLSSPFFKPLLNHDFSRIPVHAQGLGTIQPKLMIGQPNDKYEQEADQVANQVMRMPEPAIQPKPT